MPLEDFTTAVEVDPAGDLAVTANKIDVTTMLRNVSAYVAADKGVDHFGGNFDIFFEWFYDSSSNYPNSIFTVCVLSNDLGDFLPLKTAGKTFIGISASRSPSLVNSYLFYSNAGVLTYSLVANQSLDTLYYMRFKRVGNILTLYVYTDAARTILYNSVSLTLPIAWSFRYLEFLTSYNSGDNNYPTTGYVQNFDLNESPLTKIGTWGRGVGAGGLA